MAVSVRVEPINRDIQLILEEELSPQARSLRLAEFAREQIEEVRIGNRTALGREPRYETAVDGRKGASLESVRPDGVIFAEFHLLEDVLRWIGEQLVTHSPVESGRYQRSHILFADGIEIERTGRILEAIEYSFVNAVPYARKIERGTSSEAPDGVYQAVAVLASRRFGNIAQITFSFRTIGTQRNPAVIVRIPS